MKNTDLNDNIINNSDKSDIISKVDNKSDNINNIKQKILYFEENIDKNINIDDLMNADRESDKKSERKYLLNQNNKSLSFYNSKDIYNRRNHQTNTKNSKMENFSMISEIKLNEQFEINNIYKKINQTEQNKEDTNENISNNCSIEENECKLSDLLELMNTNKKITVHKIEISKIDEDFKENELTKRDNNSNLNSISKKKRGKILLDRERGLDSGTSRNSLINH